MVATEAQRLERTWLCSVVFADIVNYSSQSVQLQMKWKEFFNTALFEALKAVPTDDRVLIDTGDGACVCFMGDPEAALLSTLSIRSAFALGAAEDLSRPRVRLGINLGPVKLVRDINGNPNAIGDGINVAQRIMSFAEPNQILVSRSYFEVISRLSDDYERLFRNLGVRQDKHVREHIVYELTPPGAQSVGEPGIEPVAPHSVITTQAQLAGSSNSHKSKRMTVVVVICAALLAVGAAALFEWKQPSGAPHVATLQPRDTQGVSAAAAIEDAASEEIGTSSAPRRMLKEALATRELIDAGEYGRAIDLLNRAIPAHPDNFDLYLQLGEAYDKEREFEKAIHAFTEAIRLVPSSATAHLRRANCLAALRKDEQALSDYNAALEARPNSAPAFNGRGVFFLHLGRYDEAIRDFSEALRVSPNYSAAYLNRSRARRAIGDVQGANEDAKKADELGVNRNQISKRPSG